MVKYQLNNLLQCSICRKFNVPSNMLSCQHIFCKRCRKKIINIHVKLRCPKCKVPFKNVTISDFESLPPQVLELLLLKLVKKKTSSLLPSGSENLMPIDNCKPTDVKQTNPQEARKLSIQRCIQSLVHACQCRDANCRLPRSPRCQKMKRLMVHTKNCKKKTNGGCPICKQLIALCCYHAKHCQETKCLVPFCSNIKHKIKQQQLQQRLQQAQLLRRRIAVMNTRPTVPVSAMQARQQTSNFAMTGVTMKPGVSTSNLTPHQPGFDLDDGSSPVDAKQTNPQEARKLSIQRYIQSLVHACQCRDANCCLQRCQKMKRLMMHTKNCKRKTNGGCPICKQLIALCCYHAKYCQETKCLVLFCSNIKHKIYGSGNLMPIDNSNPMDATQSSSRNY